MHPYSFVTFGGHAFQGLFSIGLLSLEFILFDWFSASLQPCQLGKSPIQRLFVVQRLGGNMLGKVLVMMIGFFAGRNISKSVSF